MLSVDGLKASVLLSSICIGATVFLLWPDARKRAIRHLPTPPSTFPILGNTLDLAVYQLPRLHDWIAEQCERVNGRPWCLQMLGAPPMVVLSSVETFEDVLKRQFEIFDKGPRMRTIFQDVAGNGIVAVDGEAWHHQRKVFSHLFTTRLFREHIAGCVKKHIRQLCDVVQAHVNQTPDSPLNLGLLFHQFTFDTFTEVAFGVETKTLGQTTSHPFMHAMEKVMELNEKRFHQPDWLWKLKRFLNVGEEKELRQHLEVVNQTVYQIVYETLELRNTNASSTRKDVLSLFLDQQDKAIDTKMLRDIGLVILLGGKDTTALTLTWTILQLCRHPDVLEKVQRELHDKLPQLAKDPSFVPYMDDLDALVYLEAVIRETLRLYPVVPLNAKEANSDTTLSDGTFLKQGTRVSIPSYALGRMTHVWGPDATVFCPERWLDDKKHLRVISPYQFPVFHAGPRICLGKKYALLELKATLACLLSHFDFQTIKHPSEYTYAIALSLNLQGPLEVVVENKKW